jgi:hypothetical protein
MLAAGALMPVSQVLAVTPTYSFVGALHESSPCQLLVAAHESLYVLVGVKEEHDEVRCFHLEGGGGGGGGARSGGRAGEIQQLQCGDRVLVSRNSDLGCRADFFFLNYK